MNKKQLISAAVLGLLAANLAAEIAFADIKTAEVKTTVKEKMACKSKAGCKASDACCKTSATKTVKEKAGCKSATVKKTVESETNAAH